MEKSTNKSLLFIFITMLIDCIGIGIIIPVIPSLIAELTGEGLSEASLYGGWLIFSYAFMQFIFSPILGGLSDRFGRRPIILISLLGLGIDYLFLAFAPTIFWLFVGRIIAGICGASFTTATAYIADVSAPEKRAQNFGLIGAAFGIGFIIGPVLGGIFSEMGTRVPFILAASLSLANWLYGMFVLPESLSQENRRPFEWKRANPIGSLMHLKKYPGLYGLIAAIFLLYLAGQAPPSVWTYYTMLKFNWDESMVGYSLGAVGLVVAIVQGGLIRKLMPLLGTTKSVVIGLLLTILGYVLFSIATEGWMMFAFIIPFGLGGIAGPALQGLVSNQVPNNAQGELQGTLTSLMSLASVIGPLIMTNLFFFFSKEDGALIFPGAPFMLGALLCVVAFLLSYRYLKSLIPLIHSI